MGKGAWGRSQEMLREEQYTGVVYDPEQCAWAVFVNGEIIGWRTDKDMAQELLREVKAREREAQAWR